MLRWKANVKSALLKSLLLISSLVSTLTKSQPASVSVQTLQGHTGRVLGVSFRPHNSSPPQVASASDDNTIRIWNAETNSLIKQLTVDTSTDFGSVAYSPDGTRLLAGGNAENKPDDPTVFVWNPDTGERLLDLSGHTAGVHGANWSPDGSHIVSASSDSIRVWNTTSGEEIWTVEDRMRLFSDPTFSPDGTRIAVAAWNSVGYIQVRDAESGELLSEVDGSHPDENQVWAITYSPDGSFIASGSAKVFGSSGTIALWDTNSGKKLKILTGHKAGVGALSFRSDGKYLVSGAEDNTLKIWNVECGGEAVLTLSGHSGIVRGVDFSIDGKRIASASDDRTARIWDVSAVLPPIGDTTSVECPTHEDPNNASEENQDKPDPEGNGVPAFKNGALEDGDVDGAVGWTLGAWDPSRSLVFEWNSSFGTNGSGGVMIRNDNPDDSHWAQTVGGLTPGTQYRVTAMIRLDAYSWVEGQAWECGATLSRLDSYDYSKPPINGASPGTWEPVEMIFTAESTSEKIGCRLGHWSSIVSGTMFCDDFHIAPLEKNDGQDGANNSGFGSTTTGDPSDDHNISSEEEFDAFLTLLICWVLMYPTGLHLQAHLSFDILVSPRICIQN